MLLGSATSYPLSQPRGRSVSSTEIPSVANPHLVMMVGAAVATPRVAPPRRNPVSSSERSVLRDDQADGTEEASAPHSDVGERRHLASLAQAGMGEIHSRA